MSDGAQNRIRNGIRFFFFSDEMDEIGKDIIARASIGAILAGFAFWVWVTFVHGWA